MPILKAVSGQVVEYRTRLIEDDSWSTVQPTSCAIYLDAANAIAGTGTFKETLGLSGAHKGRGVYTLTLADCNGNSKISIEWIFSDPTVYAAPYEDTILNLVSSSDLPVLGADKKVVLSTDVQDLSTTLTVNGGPGSAPSLTDIRNAITTDLSDLFDDIDAALVILNKFSFKLYAQYSRYAVYGQIQGKEDIDFTNTEKTRLPGLGSDSLAKISTDVQDLSTTLTVNGGSGSAPSLTDIRNAITTDHGAGLYGGAGGTGPLQCTVTVLDTDSAPIYGAQAQIWDSSLTTLQATGLTDANGVFQPMLDAGTYKTMTSKQTDYTFTNPGTFTVSSGTRTKTIVGTAIPDPVPPSLDVQLLYLYPSDVSETIDQNAKVYIYPSDKNESVGSFALSKKRVMVWSATRLRFEVYVAKGAALYVEGTSYGPKPFIDLDFIATNDASKNLITYFQ
jgi:hypothetical protein